MGVSRAMMRCMRSGRMRFWPMISCWSRLALRMSRFMRTLRTRSQLTRALAGSL